jgi:hypothetical protein
MKSLAHVSLITLALAGIATALHVRLEEHESSLPITSSQWKNIEYACALWSDRLGFDRCYPGDTVTVYLRMNDAEDSAAAPFMYTSALPETFPGSRRLKPRSSTTIVFKDRAYVYKGADYAWNEDAPWFSPPDPSYDPFWGRCDLFAPGVCDGENAPGKQFDFITHVGHEFGHVFGFVGRYLALGRTQGEPGGFEGINHRGERFAFGFSGNASHGATSMMSLGFSAWQRAYPSRRELDACRVAMGYAGTMLVEHGAVTLAKNRTTTVTFDVADSFTIGTVEYTSSHAATTLPPHDKVTVYLSSPDGTECALGTLRAGWAKEGYARPDLSTNRGSFNPPDTLAPLRGKAGGGTWSVRYVNDSDEDVALAGCALRLTSMMFTGTRDKRQSAVTTRRPGLPEGEWRMVDIRGRTIAKGTGEPSACDALCISGGVVVVTRGAVIQRSLALRAR